MKKIEIVEKKLTKCQGCGTEISKKGQAQRIYIQETNTKEECIKVICISCKYVSYEKTQDWLNKKKR